ncbi:MAG TPA: hypothetical protein VJ946_14070, partial [Bacteroidales bacterium]|nr:hypothetical protein [Bacteroidales bacterium]
MMKSGQAFASNLESCDFELLVPALESALMDDSIEQLQNDGEAFDRFAKTVNRSSFLSRHVNEKQCIASLFNFSRLRQNKQLSTNSLVKYITFALHTANNIGDVKKGAEAVKDGEELIRESQTITYDNLVDFFNNRAVFFHNQYDFSIDNMALKYACGLEKQHAIAAEMGVEINPVFGRLCGTISQTFGFSGPDNIEDFKKWNATACRCFGESAENKTEFNNDRLRQYNYAVYAYLDAGFYEEAMAVLQEYLKMESPCPMKDTPHAFSPWQHAALARVYSDTALPITPEAVEYVVQMTTDKAGIIPPHHPWQLWCCNT